MQKIIHTARSQPTSNFQA